MPSLQSFQAKICHTAAGCLIHEGKVLLVKHKKVKAWLNPGGHMEENELPHQTAEREFWEETGVKVKAFDVHPLEDPGDSEYLPNPIATNLHWVSKPNYEARMASEKQGDEEYQREKVWKAGCEQHLGFVFLVRPTDGVEFYENVEETDGIAWFSPEELKELDLFNNVRCEVELAFSLVEKAK